MPELPEVETTKEGIRGHLEGQTIVGITVRNSKLRMPVPAQIHELCTTKTIEHITRRAKYILIHLSEGYLLIHLGMSGHLRVVPSSLAAEKHDHVDLRLSNHYTLRYRDPRRFGLFYYLEENPYQHSLLAHLGPEPLLEDFHAEYLYQKAKTKNQPIKALIMSNEIVVGVGNIYATESLFLAGIHPGTRAKMLSFSQYEALVTHIKNTLQLAIESGGTTLRDFYSFDGSPGYFSIALQMYGRKAQPCLRCKQTIESIAIAGRQSTFCPNCQPKQS